jgi:thiamine pyrophosphate-dependent acetolactate synthase large subunit-like protein
MSQRQALEILALHRGDRIVITTMSSTGVWPEFSDTPLDFGYIPSSMGEGPPLGLGLALARPERGVIVVNGDGCMLMNLGTLVTIGSNPANLFIVLLDNGIYEVTGCQPTAGSGLVDYAGLARAAGIERVYAFEARESWRSAAAQALAGLGPVFIWLKVEARLGQKVPKPPRSMAEQIRRLRRALQVNT